MRNVYHDNSPTGPTNDKFTDSYIETAFWSSHDNEDNPLDFNYDYTDLAESTLATMRDDCAKFQANNRCFVTMCWIYDGMDSVSAGHDFWLTRNGHGAGFWDGDYPVTGDALTKASKQFPSVDLYIGDDGKIYQE